MPEPTQSPSPDPPSHRPRTPPGSPSSRSAPLSRFAHGLHLQQSEPSPIHSPRQFLVQLMIENVLIKMQTNQLRPNLQVPPTTEKSPSAYDVRVPVQNPGLWSSS